MNNGIIAAIVAVVAVVAAIVFGSWYTVDQTERGVLLRTGAVIGTAQPGLGFKVPLIDSVEKISVKTITYTWDKMNSYSFDQQPADLKISVTLRAAPEKVGDLYAKFGTLTAAVNQVVSPVVNQQVKVVFGRYTAVKAIQERGPLNSAIKDAIAATLKDDPMIIIESVQLENIEFSANYLHSIEQRMLAEVEVQKLQQNAEREKVQAQITVTQATAKANAVRAEAQAAADALRLNGEARATNIRRHQPEPGDAGAGRTLERRAADHDGARLGRAVRVGEISAHDGSAGPLSHGMAAKANSRHRKLG
jgi:regulator of protease activity HflC (stomatin/prohibitin superfamily)